MIKVILVDDHQLVRDGIKALLAGMEGIEVTGEASSGNEMLALLNSNTPDVALLDISLPDISGIDLCRKIIAQYPEIKVLFLSMYTTEDYIFNAIKAGAKGYLPKNISRNELFNAVKEVSAGNEYYSETISNIILKSYIRKAKTPDDELQDSGELLSKRETEVLRCFAEGLSNPQIAEKLFISTRTVESHKNHIMQKLNLKTQVELLKYAIKNGFTGI
ncbi:MAG: response regulator transcription factor [Lentimicrobium sp.]|nr:response regulator transcription factor [Lentimicrobium sp.]